MFTAELCAAEACLEPTEFPGAIMSVVAKGRPGPRTSFLAVEVDEMGEPVEFAWHTLFVGKGLRLADVLPLVTRYLPPAENAEPGDRAVSFMVIHRDIPIATVTGFAGDYRIKRHCGELN